MRLAVADLDPITAGAGPALDYLSRTARALAVPDPVQDYFDPVLGQWRDLHTQAEHWRLAAGQVEEISEKLTIPLGGLDAVWDGQGSDTFVQHMQAIGAAGRSVSDAMAAMGEILDRTADGVQRLVVELVELLCAGADAVSSAMILPVDGDGHASRQLAETYRYSRQVFEAVRDLLEAFTAACADLDAGQPFAAVRMAASPLAAGGAAAGDDGESSTGGDSSPGSRRMPDGGREVPADGGTAGGEISIGGDAVAGPAAPGLRTLATESPAGGEPAASAAGAGTTAEPGSSTSTRGGFAGGFLPVAGFGAGMSGQDIDRKNRSRLGADPAEVFGQPIKTAPPVIGEDDDD